MGSWQCAVAAYNKHFFFSELGRSLLLGCLRGVYIWQNSSEKEKEKEISRHKGSGFALWNLTCPVLYLTPTIYPSLEGHPPFPASWLND